MSTALVSLVDGIPTTTSLKIAETFSKSHKNVLRDIDRVLSQVSEKFGKLNFEPSSYANSQGKKQPMYLLTKDGVSFLVMGYTGDKATQFKEAYIEAFNCMEKQLEAMRDTPAGYLSIEDRRPLSVLVGQWAGKARMSFPDCWRELHTVFGISSVSDLPAAQLPAALAWVQAKIDAIAPKPKKALPVPSHYLDLTRTDPIAPNELVDVLSSITYRMDITCHTELDEEFEKGRKLFSKATKNDKRLEYMICSSLVGSKFTTRDMLKSALRMAENAAKTHYLVCEAGK